MQQANYSYYHDEQALHGYLAYDESIDAPRPAVLVVHDWSGRNHFACKKAEQLAQMGYVGFAMDVFGDGRQGESLEEKSALIAPFLDDRRLLRDRLKAGVDAVCQIPQVDSQRIAVIGFCFGGLCALDLARSGANLKGVVSFHGLLNRPENLANERIKASVLALHGFDDPMVPPQQVEDFCDEMTKAEVDWQIHMYGNTKHAFTNPEAHDEQLGTVYDAKAQQRSWLAMKDFLNEMFK